MIHGIAANYHWSEREILGIRWDRLVAYIDEIRIDSGKDPYRIEPVLPEEKRYDRMLLRQLRKEANGNRP